jgi:hypothetical protein
MPRWALRALAATSALVAVLLAIAINAATVTLPDVLDHHPGRAWALVAVLGVVTIGCAVLGVRPGEPGQHGGTAGGVQIGGVRAGRDLTIGGDHNVVAGGDYTSHSTSDSPAALGSPRPRPRRNRR